MNELLACIAYAMTVLILENVLFSRALGVTLAVSITRGYRYVFCFGLVTTVVAVVASIPAYFLSLLLQSWSFGLAVEPLAFTLLLGLLYLAGHLLLSRLPLGKLSELYKKYSNDIAQTVFNCVVLAALVFPFRERLDFGASVGFALQVGAGYLIASLMVLEGQKRMATAKLPGAFRGFPAMLLYIGILAMALYGFVGHPLPY